MYRLINLYACTRQQDNSYLKSTQTINTVQTGNTYTANFTPELRNLTQFSNLWLNAKSFPFKSGLGILEFVDSFQMEVNGCDLLDFTGLEIYKLSLPTNNNFIKLPFFHFSAYNMFLMHICYKLTINFLKIDMCMARMIYNLSCLDFDICRMISKYVNISDNIELSFEIQGIFNFSRSLINHTPHIDFHRGLVSLVPCPNSKRLSLKLTETHQKIDLTSILSWNMLQIVVVFEKIQHYEHKYYGPQDVHPFEAMNVIVNQVSCLSSRCRSPDFWLVQDKLLHDYPVNTLSPMNMYTFTFRTKEKEVIDDYYLSTKTTTRDKPVESGIHVNYDIRSLVLEINRKTRLPVIMHVWIESENRMFSADGCTGKRYDW